MHTLGFSRGKKKRLYVACALKLIQVDINPEILSSTLTRDTRGRNMRALCQAKGGGGEKRQRVEEGERRRKGLLSRSQQHMKSIFSVLVCLRMD